MTRVGEGNAAAGAFIAAWAVLLIITTSAGSAASCPNEAFREAQGVTSLPACMALELVSPSQKYLAPAFNPSFSLNGERVLFTSLGALAETAGLQSFIGDRYVASRALGGWITAATSPPASAEIAVGVREGGVYALSPSLGEWLVLGSTRPQAMVGIAQIFKGTLDGGFAPFSSVLIPTDNSGTNDLQFSIDEMEIPQGTTADLTTTVFRVRVPTISYLPGDPVASAGEHNSYVASVHPPETESMLELLSRDKEGIVHGGRCGAFLGGSSDAQHDPQFNQGAISADGKRVFFTTRPGQEFESGVNEPECDLTNPLRILQRDQTPEGPVITEIAPGAPKAAGDDLFQGASADGTKVYFTSPRKLTAADQDPSAEECSAEVGKSEGCDLYLYDSTKPPAERLTDVSAGDTGDPTPGKGADVLSSITALSGDGSHVYFAAQGVLTSDPNPEGAVPMLGKPNLYVYDAETAHTAFIGTLAETDKGRLWGFEGSFMGDAYAAPLHGEGPDGEELGGDGHILAFASDAPLTAGDTDGGHRDVFRYDADTEALERISKAAPGGEENGSFDASVNPVLFNSAPGLNFGEEPRWMSEDGKTIAFNTAEALVPGDGDESVNPYVWKEGELGRIPAKIDENDEPPAVDAAGNEIAFATPSALVPADRDTAKDVYVARIDGGFASETEATPCNVLIEGCHPTVAGPRAAGNGTEAVGPPGNVKEKPKKCKKGQERRHGRCVKRGKRRGEPRKRQTTRMPRAGR